MKVYPIILVLAVLCVSCQHIPLKKPSSLPPPAVTTDSLDKNIKDLDVALQKATTRAERIKLLVDALTFKDVVTPEKK